ncbi:hypothetical protein H2200_004029 [Cladophialophora chaetospira]|uniref:Uncharacterized protein n=1 Tax=Cladophialophora chaetospira TaxID=386627 RepID=A0AA38XFI6_9EURO|nr:hypothetical protein H2200_004029 [Cladophialophora chaetospira]
MALLLTVALSVVLAALAGPSSAIAMIPRQISFPDSRQLIFLPQKALFYPSEVSLVDYRLSNEASVEMALEQIAPAAISELSSGTQKIIDNLTDYPSRTLTYSKPSQGGWNDSYTYMATMPHQVNMVSLIDSVSNDNSEIRRTLQPYVFQDCHYQLFQGIQDQSSTYISFGEHEPRFKDVLTLADTHPESASKLCEDSAWFQFPLYGRRIIWCNPNNTTADPALLAVHVLYQGDPGPGSPTVQSIIACVVRARWLPSTVTTTGSSRTVANKDIIDFSNATAFKDGVDDTGKSIGSHPLESRMIRISAEWAKRVTKLHFDIAKYGLELIPQIQPPLLATALSDIGPDYRTIASTSQYVGFSPSALPEQTMTGLNKDQYDSFKAFLTEQGSLRKYDLVGGYIIGLNWTDASSLTFLDVEYSRTGYGYDVSHVTVKLSLAVLATYASIVVIYLLYTLISGRSGTSWDSIGELFMLCLNSKQPSHLQGTSAGVETIGTYRKLMNVRINKARSAEIVFAHDPAVEKPDYSLVDVNKKYY